MFVLDHGGKAERPDGIGREGQRDGQCRPSPLHPPDLRIRNIGVAHAGAIGVEAIGRPLRGRREVEFIIAVTRTDEGFEASMLPQFVGTGRGLQRRNRDAISRAEARGSPGWPGGVRRAWVAGPIDRMNERRCWSCETIGAMRSSITDSLIRSE